MDIGLKIFHLHELDSPLLAPSVHWYNPELAPYALTILASCEFFLLVKAYRDFSIVLLNPSTGRYYKIPYPPSYNDKFECYGTYLDEANHDCKIVRIPQSSNPKETNMEVMVYSLKTNMWRVIERRFDDKCYRSWSYFAAVIRNLLHIIIVEHKNANAKKSIGCFDIVTEKWTNDVTFPHLNNLEWILLTVLDGLLCVTALETEETMGLGNCWCVWVMKEYGVEDSWFKLMSVASDDILYLDFYPIAYQKGSRDEILLCRQFSTRKCICYNVKDKKATTVTNPTIEGIHQGYICKGSLVDFPGGGNMKLHPLKQAKGITKLLDRLKATILSCLCFICRT
ncbi:F-box protein CPR1-like [Silene latifolia]|uniref:F-box protein CPR1-like n=1 Tax=Silene latifolia TaxID=37657 RepID=UPI003D76BF67